MTRVELEKQVADLRTSNYRGLYTGKKGTVLISSTTQGPFIGVFNLTTMRVYGVDSGRRESLKMVVDLLLLLIGEVIEVKVFEPSIINGVSAALSDELHRSL